MSIQKINSNTLADGAVLNSIASSVNFRNRIINGDMRIDQRNAGASALISGITQYTLDRWLLVSNPQSKLTVQRNAGSVTPPEGFTNYLGVTVTTAETITAGDFFNLVQFIEGFNIGDLGWGTAAAKSVTVSFWVRSSVTGTYSFAFRNNGETRSYVTTYTINAANTWEQKTIIIPGDISGTWNVTNERGIEVNFDFGRASETSTSNAWTASGNVRLAGTVKLVENASATFYITGVQLEAGSVATPFERRPYGTELALCQRYAYVAVSDPVGLSVRTDGTGGIGYFPQPMRATPTISSASFSMNAGSNGTVSPLNTSNRGFGIYNSANNWNVGTGGNISYTASAEL
jgi:hypothetical protein